VAEGVFGGGGEGGNLAQVEHEPAAASAVKVTENRPQLIEFRGPEFTAQGYGHFVIQLVYLCV
jgi:hypothetical protein